MPRVFYFEMVSDNPEGTMKFYNEVFGWEFKKQNFPQDYWTVNTNTGEDKGGPGIDGGLTPTDKAHNPDPVSRVTNTINVSSIDEFSNKISAAGGKVDPNKMTIPGMGYLAICQDTEGISFGIFQNDTNAK